MKQIAALAICLTLALVFAFHFACSQSPSSSPYGSMTSPTNTFTPTITNTPCTSCTPTFTPVTIYYASGAPLHYSLTPTSGGAISQPVTVAVSQQVVFDSSLTGHPLYIDIGSSCSVSNGTSYPITFVPALTPTNYIVHCGLHGACSGGNTACPTSGCTGMTFTLHAQ